VGVFVNRVSVFVILWVFSNCMVVFIICVLVFIVFRIVCTIVCNVSLIYFVCIIVKTTATE
jgi:hypothetical protein